MKHSRNNRVNTFGFTIVELLIVVVVIGILAAITIVAYTGINQQASATALKSDLTQAKTQLEIAKISSGNDTYPTPPSGTNPPTSLKTSPNTILQYTVDNTSSPATYCLSATNSMGQAFHLDSTGGTPEDGVCTGHVAPGGGGVIADGDLIQTITSTNCPATRTMAVDARDNHTYWVQRLADGNCWMLTNLAYAGGGTNTYGDAKSLSNGTVESEGTYTEPKYYIPASGSNVTTEPTSPSTLTNGSGQYGYFYNWCAAMGAQTTTSACANATTPTPNTDVSVCPSGWRLPAAGNSGDFNALNTAVNGDLYDTDVGLRNAWLAQYGGLWDTMFFSVGSYGFYWSSSAHPSTSSAYNFPLSNSSVNPNDNSGVKTQGYAIRCLAV